MQRLPEAKIGFKRTVAKIQTDNGQQESLSQAIFEIQHREMTKLVIG